MPMNVAGRIAKYLAISLAMENVVSAPRVMSSCLPMATTSMSLVGLLSRSTILPASLAAMVPVFMARPTSAWARAGASLVPSPVMATRRPPACSFLIRSILSLGVAWARKSSTPASAAVEAAGRGVSPGVDRKSGVEGVTGVQTCALPNCLLFFDQVHLVLGRGLGEEVVHTGFGRDGGRGQRVIAGDHDGADSHVAQLLEALAHAALDHVFQMHHAEGAIAIGHHQRGTAEARDAVGDLDQLRRDLAVLLADELGDAIGGAFAHASSVYIDAAHAGLRGEGDEVRLVRGHLTAADVVLFFGQDHDGTALRRLVGQAGKLRRVGQLLFAHAYQRKELHCLAVAEGNGAGFVQQQGA